ncbi:hypothetical protein FT663_01639 [Candidozyma haemuli var. vulneris]|uniref:ER-derived vesicles protein ERV29 n=1 Tax=Candidozyma haemuli TaxID=45357 RepID=A0A2V1B072_9ASCO|nr:hypothetical protein CXQ85_003043 [[Candida] haemuloni]KAF3987137.1 hypothetical protein FT662_04155 [[Candida] haemuloni var. vulneris]KAF3993929.1 hypothetical protein FT663_01639 [[Candida] haemuloni var. vulneris]PVH23309.1 hypothetical protein CXQ85_003043 [[Candida] haemuloni]
MSYRGPNQFNNQFNAGQFNPNQFSQGQFQPNQFQPNQFQSPVGRQPGNIGPVPSQQSGLERVEAARKQFESLIDTYLGPLKPYVPAIGRLFIVATFYEDALRIFFQWSEQVYYLHVYRKFWKWLTVLFLSSNVILMLAASTLLVFRRHSLYATCVLCGIVLLQGVFYGLILDSQFLLRNLSVVGGLILAFSDSLVRDKRSLTMPGLPMLNNKDDKKYFLLTGRLLLIFLFLGFVFSATWSFARVLIILVGLVACGSIVVGYKTKFAAAVLTIILFTYNVFVNQFWKYSSFNANRDFLKYEFFQTLSIVGGLLIIVNGGAGELSIDEKKKIY